MSTHTNKSDFCFTYSEDWNLNCLSLSVLTYRMGVIIASTTRTARGIESGNLEKGLSPGTGPEEKAQEKAGRFSFFPLL